MQPASVWNYLHSVAPPLAGPGRGSGIKAQLSKQWQPVKSRPTHNPSLTLPSWAVLVDGSSLWHIAGSLNIHRVLMFHKWKKFSSGRSKTSGFGASLCVWIRRAFCIIKNETPFEMLYCAEKYISLNSPNEDFISVLSIAHSVYFRNKCWIYVAFRCISGFYM